MPWIKDSAEKSNLRNMSTEQEQTLKALLEDESKAKSVYQRNRNEDNYLFCEDCQEYFLDACLVHGPPVFVVDNPIALGTPSRAFYTIPYGLAVGPSGNWEEGLGVWCTITTIPKGVFFGPLEGDVASGDEFSNIYTKSVKSGSVNNLSFSESKCNWMRFVNYSKTAEGRNLAICRHRGKIYYRVCRPIEPAEELLIWLGGVTCGDQQQQLFETYSQTDNGIPVRIVKQDQDNSCETEKRAHKNKHKVIDSEKNKARKGKACSRSSAVVLPLLGVKKKGDCGVFEGNLDFAEFGSTSLGKTVLTNECNRSGPKKSLINSIVNKNLEHSNDTALGAEQNPFSAESSANAVKSNKSVSIPACAPFCEPLHFGKGKHFECKYCGRIFSRKERLKNHMHTHTGERPYTCKECGKAFSTKSNLNVHLRIHTGNRPYICCFCGKGFYRGPHLKVHIRCHTGEKPYECNHCGKRFADSSTLQKHRKSISGCIKPKPVIQTVEPDLSFAQENNLITSTQKHYEEAMRIYEGSVDTNIQDISTSSPDGIPDHYFSEVSSKNVTMLNTNCFQHMQDETSIFGSPELKISQTSSQTLQDSHKAAVIDCKIKERSARLNLDTPSERKGFKCERCSKTFSRKQFLIQHARTHTGEKPYACSVCGKAFSEKSNMNEHLRTHTGERPYVCSFCGKGFYRSSHLKVHIRCHTGEKPYKCDRCDRTFADCSTLRRHKKSISACPKTQSTSKEPEITNDAKNERYKGCHGASETEEHESNISAQQESTWSEYQLISMNGRYVKNNCIKTE
nr:PREDICTED: zinc finger protein 569-like isoform X3 [Latimeria chalumnae]|eukprot:XP_005996287.2 PREDICTED: zinc finger protein 569-like isoform X3 [Latimeria chalumnae]